MDYKFFIRDNSGDTREVNVKDVLQKLFGLNATDRINSFGICAAEDGLSSSAEIFNGIPSAIFLSGRNELDDADFEFGYVENPNEYHQDHFVVGLYAGCTSYETDERIGCVIHDCRKLYSEDDSPSLTKIIHVNDQVASSDNWPEFIKEHVEDEHDEGLFF